MWRITSSVTVWGHLKPSLARTPRAPLPPEFGLPPTLVEKFPCLRTIEPSYPGAGDHGGIKIYRIYADRIPISLLPVLVMCNAAALSASIVVTNSVLPGVALETGRWSFNLHGTRLVIRP